MSSPTAFIPTINDCPNSALNLTTYGAVDWAIFCLILTIYSMFWCTFGICCHRWRVRKLLLTDENIDDIASVKQGRTRFNSMFSRWSGRSSVKHKSKHMKNRKNSQENVMLSPQTAALKGGVFKKTSFSTINEEDPELKEAEEITRPDFDKMHLGVQPQEPRMSEISMTSAQIQPIVGKSFAFPKGKGANKMREKMKQKYQGKAITVEVDEQRTDEQIAAAAPAAVAPVQQQQQQYGHNNMHVNHYQQQQQHPQNNSNSMNYGGYSAYGNNFGVNNNMQAMQQQQPQQQSYHPAMAHGSNTRLQEKKDDSSDSSDEDNLQHMYGRDGQKKGTGTALYHHQSSDQVVIMHDSSERSLNHTQANQVAPQHVNNGQSQFPHISFGLYGQQ